MNISKNKIYAEEMSRLKEMDKQEYDEMVFRQFEYK